MQKGTFGQPCISRHEVMVHDRGGAKRVAVLKDITKVKYGRTLSGQYVAQIDITGKKVCENQLAELKKIKVRRHEIVIFRGSERTFEGPVMRVKWLSDGVQIMVKDVTEYLKGTSLSKDWPGPDGGGPALMTDRLEEIIEWELTVPYQMRIGTGGAAQVVTVNRWETIATPANVLPHLEVRPSATLETTSSTVAFEMNVLDHLNDRARSALNYATVGRKIIIWDSAQLLGKTRKLTDADFYGNLEVYEDGSDYSNIQHLSAQREDKEEEPVIPAPTQPGVTPGVGHDGGEDPYFGVWEYVASSSSEEGSEEPTQDELNSQAQRIDRTRSQLPLLMKVPGSAGIRLSSDLTLAHLVPGTVMPVSATFNLREVTQDQLLTAMTVTEDESGETIAVTLAPAGPLAVI